MSNNREILNIPVDRASVGEFISGLLGQRRLIETSIRDRAFVIDVEWLINLDHLIQQRVESQHEAQIVEMKSILVYGNGRVRTLPTRDALHALNDLSQDESVSADLRWTYLIQFAGVAVPEKQEIRFRTDASRNYPRPCAGTVSLIPLWDGSKRS